MPHILESRDAVKLQFFNFIFRIINFDCVILINFTKKQTLKVLYISYDGMTDQLGQSQVIPYLKGLSEKGHEILLISCEKKTNYKEESGNVTLQLNECNISWYPLKYTAKPKVLSTLFDLRKIKHTAEQIMSHHNIDIIHCRSYIAALIGLSMKRKYCVKFLFDMRGFWADERFDGEIWSKKNLMYQIIYEYFKKKEKEFLVKADQIISLTENAKKIMLNWHLTPNPLPIEVIPCCADFKLFNKDNITNEEINYWRQRLNIMESDFTMIYLGTAGTWNMVNEMLDFFKVLLQFRTNAKFLFITPDLPEKIIKKANLKGIPVNRIAIQKGTRQQVPVLISLSDIAIFFIKPVFSKQASSPTKMGETMGMGVPLICNANVGDVDEIVRKTKVGYLINSFDTPSYEKAINAIPGLLNIHSTDIRNSARKYFSLESGVEKYDNIYRNLI